MDHPAYYQCSVSKPVSLVVWGCVSAYGIHILHIWKSTINAEMYIQVLKHLFQGMTVLNCILHGFIIEDFRSDLGPDLPPTENI